MSVKNFFMAIVALVTGLTVAIISFYVYRGKIHFEPGSIDE
jgi:hypothetical protein